MNRMLGEKEYRRRRRPVVSEEDPSREKNLIRCLDVKFCLRKNECNHQLLIKMSLFFKTKKLCLRVHRKVKRFDKLLVCAKICIPRPYRYWLGPSTSVLTAATFSTRTLRLWSKTRRAGTTSQWRARSRNTDTPRWTGLWSLSRLRGSSRVTGLWSPETGNKWAMGTNRWGCHSGHYLRVAFSFPARNNATGLTKTSGKQRG